MGPALAKDYLDKSKGDLGKAALAMNLGKSPDKLTAADLADPKNKELMQAAKQAEQNTGKPEVNTSAHNKVINTKSGPIEMDTDFANRLVDAVHNSPHIPRPDHMCYHWGKKPMKAVGINLTGGESPDAIPQLLAQGFKEIPAEIGKDLPGAARVSSNHFAIVTGKGTEYFGPDRARIRPENYEWTRYFVKGAKTQGDALQANDNSNVG